MHQKMLSFDELIAFFAESIGLVGIHEYFLWSASLKNIIDIIENCA